MEPKLVRLLVIACAFALAIVALAASALSEPDEPVPLTAGVIFSTERGDPVDVALSIEDSQSACAGVSGSGYGSTATCFDLRGADTSGSYQVVVPLSEVGAPIVVGVLPVGALGATVAAGDTELRADTRGRWFLVELPPGSLGTGNAAPVTVEYYS